MAKDRPIAYLRQGRFAGHSYDPETGRIMVRVEWPSQAEEPAPRPLTQKQRMILTIARRRWRDRIPVSIADVLKHVRAVWKDECRRRKLPEPWPPVPNRDTVARVLRATSLID